VIGIPDSATTAALGFAEESGIGYDIGLIRNHYVGRTFIHPLQSARDLNVRIKFNPVKGVLKGKKIVLVDDSIVRGTTLKKLVSLIKTAEPAEIHLRISSPPIVCPCFYGIDMPTKEELIASSQSVEDIRAYLGWTPLATFDRLHALGAQTRGAAEFLHRMLYWEVLHGSDELIPESRFLPPRVFLLPKKRTLMISFGSFGKLST